MPLTLLMLYSRVCLGIIGGPDDQRVVVNTNLWDYSIVGNHIQLTFFQYSYILK